MPPEATSSTPLVPPAETPAVTEDDDKDLIAELLTAQNERITALESGFANFAKEVKDFFTLKPTPAAPSTAAPKATETVVKPAAEAAKEVAQKAKHGAGLFW